MKKEVFRRFFIVIIVALTLCGVIAGVTISKVLLNRTEQDMRYVLRLADYGMDYQNDLQSEAEKINCITLTEDSRITILNLSGTVLADSSVSDSERLENHKDRDEVKQAFHSGWGSALRYSDTVGKQLLYVAYRSESQPDYVIRLAVPFYGIHEFFPLLLPALLISIALSVLVASFLASRFSQSITNPLTEISGELLKVKDKNAQFHFGEYDYEELNQIVSAVVKLSDRVSKTMEKLEQERNKIDYILENMTEGFLLLDQDEAVLIMNKAAKRFLSCPESVQGNHIIHYTQNMQLIRGIDSAVLQDGHLTFDLPIGDRILSIHISKIQNGIFEEGHTGMVVLMVDVTEQRNAQVIRQEFFSNASHELKTPITSIRGYAELLSAGMVSDEEQQKEFLQRIMKETKNMTGLINDILTISQLENGQTAPVMGPVRMKTLTEDAVHALLPLAEQNQVTVQWESEDISYQGNLQQLQQLLTNLMSNAIKYNKPGGTVKILVRMIEQGMQITVSDTGIGIPEEYRQRIFERFFRVDKGRSRKMGGTGLGLSIVKHIVNCYHGFVSVKSEVDVGTTITVILPAEKK